MTTKPREFALRILERAAVPGDFLERWLEDEDGAADLVPVDRALARELICGVIRWQSTLDWLISRRTEGRPQHPLIRDLLRLGLYQLFWLDRIPPHAAVNESVELARERGFAPQAGFVNAVLRGCQRDRSDIDLQLSRLKESDPAIGFSHPEWLVQRWAERLAPGDLRRMLAANNSPPSTFARVNTLRSSTESLLVKWRAEGVAYRPFQRDWFGENLVFELDQHPPIASLNSFQEGGFYLQDPSTLLAVSFLEAQPGETILDLCAAPGGKATYIAQCMGDKGTVFAHDRHAGRLKLVQENVARLGTKSVAVVPGLPAGREFDRVLIDAPCSNTGVIRRRVQSRWRVTPDELRRLPEDQLGLLKQVTGRVRKGGVIVYSTCSLEPEENHAVVEEFVSRHSGFEIEATRELIPGRDGTDGAYVARLRRKR